MMHNLQNKTEVQRYLTRERFLTPETLRDADIQVYTDRQGDWIVFPLGAKETDGAKLRAAPGNRSQAKAKYLPKDTTAQLYYRENLADNPEKVYIAEGEIDCLLLNQLGYYAVSSTSGAQTFLEGWLPLFPEKCEVVLVFDNDPAGYAGRKKVREMFLAKRKDILISDIEWGVDKKKGYDVSDFVAELKEEGLPDADIKVYLDDMVTPYVPAVDGDEGYVRKIAEVRRPHKPVGFAEWRGKIEKEFPELVNGAEACLSVICQLLIQNIRNPFALILLDAPSSGKTICLDFFTGVPEVAYPTDNFTAASMVSHAASRKEADLEKIDMLPQIRFKTMIVREMACIFGEREDDLKESLGMLTRVLDGEGLQDNSGIHGRRGYQGDYLFMMLGAAANIPFRFWKVTENVGHRFFFMGLRTCEDTEESLLRMSARGDFKVREVECQRKTNELLRTLWNKYPQGVKVNIEDCDEAILRKIANWSMFLAKFRGDVRVGYGGNKEESMHHSTPRIEKPRRIMQWLHNLCAGHAIACGRGAVTEDDLQVMRWVVGDSAPEPRPDILRLLIKEPGHKVTTLEVTEALGCSPNTAKREMTKMMLIGICEGDFHVDEGVDDSGLPELDSGGRGNQKKIWLRKEFSWLYRETF